MLLPLFPFFWNFFFFSPGVYLEVSSDERCVRWLFWIIEGGEKIDLPVLRAFFLPFVVLPLPPLEIGLEIF